MKKIAKHLIPNAGALILAGLLLLVQAASARQEPAPAQPAAPSQTLISYQGTLTDENGNPVNDTVSMVFALYDAPGVGNLKWGPETQSVQVTNGLFNVLLGSVAPINPATLTGDLYLGITVNSEQMTPRELLTSAVYAVEAGSLSAGDVMVKGHLVFAHSDGTPYPTNWIGMADSLGDNKKWLHIGGITDDDGIRRLAYYATTHYFNGNVGIGTTSPEAKLHIAATEGHALIATGPVSLWGAVGIHDNLYVNGALSAGGNLAVSGDTLLANNLFMGSGVALRQSADDPRTLHLLPWGGPGQVWDNVCIGCGASADLIVRGDVTCGALTENNLQTPEEQAAGGIDRFEEGDVLCWSPKAQRLEKCSAGNDPLVQAIADKSGRPIVIGAEVVKVVGPVRAGDYLVASSVPGYAMASAIPTFGIVIAQALEDFDGEQGIIKAMIRKM